MPTRCTRAIRQTLAGGAISLMALTPAFAQDVTYQYDLGGNLIAIHKATPSSSSSGPGGITITVTPPHQVQLRCGVIHCGVPAQPKLASGMLHGHQVCGTFSGLASTFTFTCGSLPSVNDNGWQLTPLNVTNPDGKSHPNKAVILKISTPTQTELLIEFENQAGSRIQQEQVTRQPGDSEIHDVGPSGQVAEVMSDDATNRTWTLQFLLNTCTDVAKLNIYTIGSSGTTNGVRSNPLHVWLLRDPAELSTGSCS